MRAHGLAVIANEPTFSCKRLAHRRAGQHAVRRGKRLKKHPGSSHRRTDAPHRSLIISARGGAVLAAPEALTQRKTSGQELMVELFGPSGRQLPVQKGAHFGLADIE